MASPNQGVKGMAGLRRMGNMAVDRPVVWQQKAIIGKNQVIPCVPLTTLGYGKPPQCCK